MIRVIIAGGRDYADRKKLFAKCRRILSTYRDNNLPIEIVNGKCPTGADFHAVAFAKKEGYSIVYFEANWDLFGLAAGGIRNGEMADYANVLIAFWDGKSRGTADMIAQARRNKLIVRVIKY